MAVINIILGLLENGIEVFVVASNPPQDYKIFLKRLEENGAKLFVIPSNKQGIQYWKSLATKTKEIVSKHNIPIIHLHLPKLVYFLGKDLKKMNKKIVFTVEGDPIYEVRNMGLITKLKTKMIWKRCLNYVDLFCPCSNWLANEISKREKIERMKPIHNPIDVTRFENPKNLTRDELKLEQDDFVIVAIARLTPVKDLETLLRGFDEFIKDGKKKSRLLILGEGELKNELESLSKKLQIDKLVDFLGFRNNPQDYIALADVFVMTSNYEPFGMPAAEAGCMGIPTIVSKAGGLMEIVLDGKTGYQFSIGNHKELAHYLGKLYSEPEIRKRFSLSAKEHIFVNFSPKVIAEKFIKIYQELI
jgi:glycosyltransferase involved in cell wall biosynthesis